MEEQKMKLSPEGEFEAAFPNFGIKSFAFTKDFLKQFLDVEGSDGIRLIMIMRRGKPSMKVEPINKDYKTIETDIDPQYFKTANPNSYPAQPHPCPNMCGGPTGG